MTAVSARKTSTASSTVAIVTAVVFVFSTAFLGLVEDRSGAAPQPAGGDWTLRGQVDDPVTALPTRNRAWLFRRVQPRIGSCLDCLQDPTKAV